MKNQKARFLIVILLVAILISASACSGNNITGTWESSCRSMELTFSKSTVIYRDDDGDIIEGNFSKKSGEIEMVFEYYGETEILTGSLSDSGNIL
ncbi:MAG: hypothetical protein FWD19_04560 [Defluviitaleaceae bacterium]|nr:hypothetical protein [Defluviitaleaceae bacterium]